MPNPASLPPHAQAPGTAQAAETAEALARALRAGDEAVLGRWYTLEFPAVRRLCLGFLADSAEADDAAQEALLRLRRGLPGFDPSRAYGAWRNSLVANLCRDRLRQAERRRRREQGHAREEADPGPGLAPLENAEFEADLCRALAALSPREREVFVMIDLEELEAAQAAEQLGIEASSLRAYLSLARAKLRERLRAHAPEGGSR